MLGSTNTSVAGLKQAVDDIKTDIRDIRTNITEIFKSLGPAAVTRSSPLTLTDFGHQLSQRLQAVAWAHDLAPTLLDKVQNKQAFQIDEYAEDYVKRYLSADMKDRVALCVYEYGTNRPNVLLVLRVVLRDELIKLTGVEQHQQAG